MHYTRGALRHSATTTAYDTDHQAASRRSNYYPGRVSSGTGITEESTLQVTLSEGALHVKPVRVTEIGAGSPYLKELYEYFAPAREEVQDKGLSGEEIDAAVDQAVTAVRRSSKQYEA